MPESHELGKKGEELAVEYLKDNGYTIIARNWTWGKHEIDIIASRKKIIVFAEVKTRSIDYQVHPREAVNREKQKSMITAANGYIQSHQVDNDCRFDVITVVQNKAEYTIDHIEDAFYPTLK